MGYADNLPACCASEQMMDRSMKIVYRRECTWHYEFNAQKSEILVWKK